MFFAAAVAQAVHAIAVDALDVGVGGTLKRNTDYQEQFGIGAGTMQRALGVLADAGALTTVSRGHLGREVESMDVAILWNITPLPPVRLLFPPRGPAEIDALAVRLAEELSQLGVAHTIGQMPGGQGRLEAVCRGEYDVALTSAGVAAAALRTARRVQLVLPAGTYYATDRLTVVTRTDLARPVRRVAIDSASPDHWQLTRAEFPADEFEYVECNFPLVPTAVLAGEVDAGIWHVTRTILPLDLVGLTTRPISGPRTLAVWQELSRAVLIAGGRPEMRGLLGRLDLDDIARVQAAALQQAFDGQG